MNIAHWASRALHKRLGLFGPALGRANAPLAEMIGMGSDVAAALCWSQWLPWANARSEPSIVLGISSDVPSKSWPAVLRSPFQNHPVRVRCVLAERPGQAHSWLRMSNEGQSYGNGTLGAILRVRNLPDHLCALTAGHVLGGGSGAQINDPIRLATPSSDVAIAARLRAWQPDFSALASDVRLDAGIAVVEPNALELLGDELEWPAGFADPGPMAPLALLTRQHRLQATAFGLINAPMNVGDDGLLRYQFASALSYDVPAGTEPGDSGAPIWDINDRLVAIHTGSSPPGTTGNAIATPIRRILSWADADVVLRIEIEPNATLAQLKQVKTTSGLPEVPIGDLPIQPNNENARAIDTLARTMWGEARGEPNAREAMSAVAHVVLNRRAIGGWWGNSIEAVCLKPYQFSCWNEGDGNRSKILRVTLADPQFSLASVIAGELAFMAPLARGGNDITKGATHYHATSMSRLPNWAQGKTPCAWVGHHVFYNNI